MGNPKRKAMECGSSLAFVTSFIQNNHRDHTIRHKRNPCACKFADDIAALILIPKIMA